MPKVKVSGKKEENDFFFLETGICRVFLDLTLPYTAILHEQCRVLSFKSFLVVAWLAHDGDGVVELCVVRRR